MTSQIGRLLNDSYIHLNSFRAQRHLIGGHFVVRMTP